MPLADLLAVLRAALPDAAPFGMLPYRRPLVPLLLLFVHRVNDLEPGLYALCRDGDRLAWLQGCAPRHAWQPVPAAHEAGVPLFGLRSPEDVREAAKALSCQQDWAARGCVALAFFAEHEPLLRAEGAWLYRRAHWEAGMVGQALYLGAEAVGCGGTAMGCFFGPWTHQTMGIDARQLQDLEHFTLGYPVEDLRVQTIPAYAHLGRFRRLQDRDAVDTGSEDKALAQLSQTVAGSCVACGRKGVEGRRGTDEFEGQFYCGRCWASWSPKARTATEEDSEEDTAEAAAQRQSRRPLGPVVGTMGGGDKAAPGCRGAAAGAPAAAGPAGGGAAPEVGPATLVWRKAEEAEFEAVD